MRTVITSIVVTLLVLIGVAYALGVFAIATEQSPGKYVIRVEVNTGMFERAGAAERE